MHSATARLRVPHVSCRVSRGEFIQGLDWLAAHVLPAPIRPSAAPAHRDVGEKKHAYFYLRSLGYVMVARNFRSPRCRGEIDLIGWEQDVLCFIEVKTRTSRDIKPARGGSRSAQDDEKWRRWRGST